MLFYIIQISICLLYLNIYKESVYILLLQLTPYIYDVFFKVIEEIFVLVLLNFS